MRTARLLILALAGSVLLSGCYFQAEVESSEVGLVLPDGVTIGEIKGAGRYTSFGYYAELKKIDVSAQTLEWSDPDLVTRDLQPMGLKLQITYARDRDPRAIELMWNQYRLQATNDDALVAMVLGRIPAAAKEITARYTLNELIGTSGNDQGGRSLVAKQLSDLLAPQLNEFGVALLDVGVTNIDPGQAYIKLLQEKANVALQKDIAEQRTAQLVEQLNQEKAQTQIALEIARRENDVVAAQNKVYEQSAQAYELERLRRLSEILGDNSTVYFVKDMADLNVVLGGGPAVIPQGGSSTPTPTPTPTPNRP